MATAKKDDITRLVKIKLFKDKENIRKTLP